MKSKAEKRRERQARTRARREERRERRRAEQFGTVYREWLIRQDCMGCPDGRPPYVQPAHVRHTRGAGGKAQDQAPLCWRCHRWEETASDAEFLERFGMTRDEMATTSWERFQADMAAGRDLLVGDAPW